MRTSRSFRYHEAVCGRRSLFRLGLPLVAFLGPALVNLAGADEKVSDDLLYDRVNRALVTDRELGVRPLKVAVQDGKVTVTGFVEEERLRERVEKVVKKVKGVRDVDNQVKVRR